jgi:glycosyltransferase involved in cell wall biosynthesis
MFMTKKIKTLFIGPFSPPNSGDGVKNDYLREGFEAAGIKDIVWFDTIRRSGSRLAFYFRLFGLMATSKQIILSLNKLGRYAIIPLFWFLSLFAHKKGVLYVIGGTFDQQMDDLLPFIRKIFVQMVNRLDGVFAESKALKAGLEKRGVCNVDMLYNPRKDNGIRWRLTDENRTKAVFISRVTDDKGVTALINAVESIKYDNIDISLDVYGPIDSKYEAFFRRRVAGSNGTVAYKGILKPDEVQTILLQYHFLALPTFHYGEGLPGILVEAGLTGMPIVITRHNALPEYFRHNKSAIFVEPNYVEDLKNGILRLMNDDKLNAILSEGILETVEPFKLENVIRQSLEFMEAKGWIF